MRNNKIFERVREDVTIPVPDMWNKIKEAYTNNTFVSVPAKNIRRFAIAHYIAMAACIALIAIVGGNLFNSGHFPAILKNESNSTTSSDISIAPTSNALSKTTNSLNPTQSQLTNNSIGTASNAPSKPTTKPSSQSVSAYFNAASMAPSKIGGIVRSVTSDKWNQFYSVKTLPYSLNYKLLYKLNTEINPESIPIAGILSYSEDKSWFTIAVSKTEKLQDVAVDCPVITKTGNTEVIFASYENNHYAGFTFNNYYYSIETGGFSESEIIKLVDQLIS